MEEGRRETGEGMTTKTTRPGGGEMSHGHRDRLEELVHARTVELVREVDERRQAQRALEASEERYRRLFSASRDALLVFPLAQDGTTGTFVEVNDVVCDLLGYSQQELLAMSPADIAEFDLEEEPIRAALAELLQEQRLDLEWEYVARDGTHIPVEIRMQLLELGGARMVLASARDIAERRREERDLELLVEGTVGLTGRSFFRALVQHVAQSLQARYVLLAELEPGGASARTLAFWDDRDWADDFTFPLAGSACGELAGRDECYHPVGARARFPRDPSLARLGVEGYHGLSLRDAAGETLGFLLVMDTQPLADNDRGRSILRLFAARAAAELERASTEAALRRYANEQSALYAVASALNSSLDPNDLLDTILDVLLPVTGADAGWISLPGHTPQIASRTVAWKGLPDEETARALAVPLSLCSACAPYLQGGAYTEPVVVVRCPHVSQEVLDRAGLESQACVPLLARGHVLGTLSLAWRGEHWLGKQEEALLLALGYQTGLGLRHAQLYQQARQVDQLRVLAVLDRALAASLDPHQVAELTLQHMAKAVGAADALLLPHVAGLGGYPRQVLTLAEGWTDLDSSQRYAGWRLFLDDLHARTGGEERAGPAPRTYTTTTDDGIGLLVVPIADDGQFLAHLVLAGRAFGQEGRLLAQAAAGRAAQAVRNAQLYAEVRALLREREETQAQLVQSEKMTALGRLAASFAHEINNPIQAVLGCLGLAAEELEEGRSLEVLERYVTIAREEVRRIGSILHRMRDFYQPAGQGIENADPREILEDVLALMATQLAHRRVEVEQEWDDVPPIQANPNQLKQVFLNLAINAADAMPNGGKLCIRVTSGRKDEHGAHDREGERPLRRVVRVEFCDQGRGIPAELQSRLFEPFFTTKKDGSGLGLYISYGIIRAHHGRIVVHSREGEGTTFTILLPVRQPESEDGPRGGA